MKHLKLYEAFEGSKLPEGVMRIDQLGYYKMLGPEQADLPIEERATLEAVCKYIGFYEWIIPTNKAFFTMAKHATAHTYMKPLAIFGVTKTGEHTLCTYTEYGFNKDSYYTASSLEPLLQVAIDDMKAQPQIEWAEIR